jgi:hypothetical protein
VELFDGFVQRGAAGQLFRHRLRRQFSNSIRSIPLIWFPPHKNNFEEVAFYASGTLQSHGVFEPKPWSNSPAGRLG